MSETLTCPHCETVYQLRSIGYQLDHNLTRCPHCQKDFQFMYGRSPELAAQARAGLHAGTFRCPFCSSSKPPVHASKISVTGWILCVVLLVFFFPLCWVGLLIKDKSALCSSCGMKLA